MYSPPPFTSFRELQQNTYASLSPRVLFQLTTAYIYSTPTLRISSGVKICRRGKRKGKRMHLREMLKIQLVIDFIIYRSALLQHSFSFSKNFP